MDKGGKIIAQNEIRDFICSLWNGERNMNRNVTMCAGTMA